MFTYLLINVLSFIGPFLLSFDKKIQFYKKWKYLFPSILLSAIPMIIKDSAFTKSGVWGFTDAYLTGVKLWGLPIEEIFFFFTVPYAIMFIYECVIYYIKLPKPSVWIRRLFVVGGAVFVFAGVFQGERLYTGVILSILGIFMMIHGVLVKESYQSYFLLSYAISIIPFLIVNGLLTHGLRQISPNPIVWYQNDGIANIRFFTIPIEDFLYSMLMFLLNVTIYEGLKREGSKEGLSYK